LLVAVRTSTDSLLGHRRARLRGGHGQGLVRTQRRRGEPGRVNFWQPGGNRRFRALSPDDSSSFTARTTRWSAGFFARASLIDASLAWDAFGANDDAASFPEMRRRWPIGPRTDRRVARLGPGRGVESSRFRGRWYG